MSSDSEDEDELLQIALKEQAQRDPNYQRPSSNQRKPVVNFVQQPRQHPPTQRPASTTNMANQQQLPKNRRAVDVDDSEVEMLSISSGDEEVSEVRGGEGGITARGRAGHGSGRREEERGWDGEEPDCWKRVDEAELARRVRGMRETRTAPVTQKFERKPSALARKGLNALQSFPRGMECIDPLGLGIIDSKSLRLITDSSESSPSKSNKDHLDNNLRAIPISIHQNTSAADLEAGTLALKTDLKGRTQQRKQLVKDNFDCFVSCKTTIDGMQSSCHLACYIFSSGTSRLFNCMQGVSSLANRAFEPLFERQAQTEKIRSVQGMLQRFRTLFNLPSTIRGSIGKGEYDLAVREYKKAKSIALPSHVNLLKRVLEEVEKVVNEFKGTLYKSMEEPQIDLANLENTVRLLLELDPESDPVWYYLNVQNHRIRGLLEKCTLDQEARMETLHNEMRERASSDSKWRQTQQNLNQSSDFTYSLTLGNIPLSVDSQPVDLNGEEADVLRGKYIRRLTAVLTHHIPAFWKVALSVFSGKFAKSSQVSAESNVNASATKSEEKVGNGRYSTHSLDEVAGMIRDTISAYETKACQAFEVKESAPPTAVMALRTLQAGVTKIYILRLCSWMRTTAEEISKEETWIPVSILKEKNLHTQFLSCLLHSALLLPLQWIKSVSKMIQSLRSEAGKSEDMFSLLQEIEESVRLTFLNCFLDFAGTMNNLFLFYQKNLHLQNGYSHESEEKSSSDLEGSAVDSHQQLLLVLSNIGYCKDELSYELFNKYKTIWLQSREKDEEDSDIQDLVMSFSGLEGKVLAQYTFAKTNLIRTAAMDYLLNSGAQWGAAPAVKGVRDAAVELLHTLVAVHSEVFACAKPLLDKLLGILVQGLIDTFLSLYDENKSKDLRSLDANGFCQLMLELEYFETILNPYLTPDARESIKSLQGVLLEKATESVENPGYHRRSTLGSEDALADDRQQGMTVSPDDLILERTRINTACFVESIPLDSAPESAKAAYSYRGSMDSPRRNYMDSPGRNYRGSQAMVPLHGIFSYFLSLMGGMEWGWAVFCKFLTYRSSKFWIMVLR
ncbi:Exocyst complex component Sec5 family protein [Salix suchowensis]|nr:Exocyst complex component Sec5 family protein [Salix suchowensis]